MSTSTRQAIAQPTAVGGALVIWPDGVLPEAVRQAWSRYGSRGALRVAGDYLDALGSLATGSPPEVVVAHQSALDENLSAVAAALRELAPGARLVLVAQPPPIGQLQSPAAIAAGFNQHLCEPIDADRLLASLQVRPFHGPGFGPGDEPSDSDAPPTDADELGDVDLVEHLLRQRTGVCDLALKIIRTRSDHPAINWCKSQHDLPTGVTSLRVEHDGNTFGLLYAPGSVAVEQLAGWAGWLGRWMALEARLAQLWDMALRDELTGVWNRRYFDRFLRTVLQRAANERFRVTLMVFDIDNFKQYNDTYGHAAGDDILREAARLMKSVVRDHDVVARIGGDEFAVIFWDSEGPRKPGSNHPTDVSTAAKRFQHAICAHKFPKLMDEAPGNLTISGGLASFPWDGRTPEDLLNQADQAAMQSKRQGKNVVTFGPGAARVCNGDAPQA